MSFPLPNNGDIIRTRFVFQSFGRWPTMTFWWKVLNWDPTVNIRGWCRTVVLRYFFACDRFQNSQSRVVCCLYRNLSETIGTTPVVMDVRGISGEPSSSSASGTLWTTRYGVDASGNWCQSNIPMSNVAMPQRAGRAEGDGQPFQWHDYLIAVQLFSALQPTTWRGGFISRKDGSFVETRRVFMNPQIKEMKRRTRRCAYSPPLLLP
jgi:hypothetical protein